MKRGSRVSSVSALLHGGHLTARWTSLVSTSGLVSFAGLGLLCNLGAVAGRLDAPGRPAARGKYREVAGSAPFCGLAQVQLIVTWGPVIDVAH